MLLFKDIVSGDELFSDGVVDDPRKDILELDDIIYEVNCKMVQVKSGVDVDIGANPSAEEAEEGLDDSEVKTVNLIIDAFRLQETSFDKKSYMIYIKGYMKKLKEKLKETDPDRVTVFEGKAPVVVKKILENFKDYEFYTGESMDTEGMVLLLNYREDGITPFFTLFKDGLKEEKL